MKKQSIAYKRIIWGEQFLFRFPNNYGASVVSAPLSYGGLELAVLKFVNPFEDVNGAWDICYDTPVALGAEGHLTPERMEELLSAIEAL